MNWLDHMRLMLRICSFLSILLTIIFSSLFLAEVSQAQEALVMPEAQLATIHVYRLKSIIGMGVYFDVYAGADKVCYLQDGQYCTFQVLPGEVEIWSSFMTKGAVTLDVQPLHEYYVKASVTKGIFLFWRPHMVDVMERVGKSEISRCDRVSE